MVTVQKDCSTGSDTMAPGNITVSGVLPGRESFFTMADEHMNIDAMSAPGYQSVKFSEASVDVTISDSNVDIYFAPPGLDAPGGILAYQVFDGGWKPFEPSFDKAKRVRVTRKFDPPITLTSLVPGRANDGTTFYLGLRGSKGKSLEIKVVVGAQRLVATAESRCWTISGLGSVTNGNLYKSAYDKDSAPACP